MSKIDWQEIGKMNGLSFEEFRAELLQAAIAMCALGLEGENEDKIARFTAKDYISKLELLVRRIEE